MDDVSHRLRAFLDYAAGRISRDAFAGKLDEAVKAGGRDREWRHEYMTLLMGDQENMERGKEEGFGGMVASLKK